MKAHPTRESNLPALSYTTAMQLWIATEQGEVTMVEACSAQQFQALLEQSLSAYQSTSKPAQERLNACRTELAGLEWDHLSKWFALLTLQEYNIPISLFASYEDASTHQEMIS